MTLPTLLPRNTTVLQRLFAEMPKSFSVDPLETGAIQLSVLSPSLSVSDYISITIADAQMKIHSFLPYIDSEVINLKNYTINNLIMYLNAKYPQHGLMATRSGSTSFSEGNFLCTTLIEGIYDIGNTTVIVDRFTSINYALLSSISVGLLDNEANMRLALAQTDLARTTGLWIDYWGHLLGVERLGNEISSDINYRDRIQREVVDKKTNNVALEKLISDSISREATIIDGGQPFILSGSYTISGSFGTFGSTLPIANVQSSQFLGYISNSTLTVITNPLYVGTTTEITATGSSAPSGSGSNWILTLSFASQIVSPFSVGQTIQVSGSSVSAYNGTWVVYASTTSSVSWKYSGSSPGTATATFGKITSGVVAQIGVGYTLSPLASTKIISGSGVAGTYTVQGTASSGSAQNLITFTATHPSTAIDEVPKLGPITGAGSFVVYVELLSGETVLPQDVQAALSALINDWKPVGVPFVLKSM